MGHTISRACRFLTLVLAGAALTGTALAGEPWVDYQADTLPPAPWQFISNGPPGETSQHTVFVEDGVLHMIDGALLHGNSLGYLLRLPLEPDQVIVVEFRARVLSGSTTSSDGRAPFGVWLHNGAVRGDLAVGPDNVSALGEDGLVLNQPFDGISWHVYRYRLTPDEIEWWADDVSFGSVATDMLIQNDTETDRRINMMISSAAAHVELDWLVLDQYDPEPPVPALSAWGSVALLSLLSLALVWRLRRSRA